MQLLGGAGGISIERSHNTSRMLKKVQGAADCDMPSSALVLWKFVACVPQV
jgi:hypothetical protein